VASNGWGVLLNVVPGTLGMFVIVKVPRGEQPPEIAFSSGRWGTSIDWSNAGGFQ
jgi:hypothetical protein